MKKLISLLVIALFFSVQVINAQNAPVSTIGTVETYGSTAVVPITVTGFSDIGGCDYKITYDPAVATATSITWGPGAIPSFWDSNIDTPGKISVGWLYIIPWGSGGLTLSDNSVFLIITFERVGYGYSAIEFNNNFENNCVWTDWNFDELDDIPNSDYYFNGSVTFPSGSTEWTGDIDNDWSDGMNWSAGVPGATTMADISDVSPNAFPSASSTAECLGLDIVSDASVTVPASNTLTVYGNVSNEGQFTVESDGSFINYGAITGTGAFEVKRYLTEDEWHYVSSPNTDAQSNAFMGIWLRPFDETSYSWGDYITSTTESLEVMEGYGAWAYDPSTVSFDGRLNYGSDSIYVTNTSQSPGYAGYNLVGNPYPSALDWDLVDGWDKTNVDNTIYFWKGVGDGGGGNYYYYNGGLGEVPPAGFVGTDSKIPAMQGFFVRATSSGIFGVNNDARVHDSKAFYKGGEENTLPIIRLMAINTASVFDETIIRFYSGASAEHDGDYDAFKLQGYMVPQLYSITPEQSKLAINTYPTYEDGTVIPLGFVSPEEGEYSIALSEFENFEAETTLYLEDMLTNNMYNLSLNPEYVFASSPDDIEERFNLHFGDMVGIPETNLNTIYIYSFENIIKVRNPENVEGNITIFNLTGQEVAKTQTGGSSLSEIRITSSTGYFLVKFQSEKSIVTKKVFIK